jgi:hypothetical protein
LEWAAFDLSQIWGLHDQPIRAILRACWARDQRTLRAAGSSCSRPLRF